MKKLITYCLLITVLVQSFGIGMLEWQRYQNYLSRFFRPNKIVVLTMTTQEAHQLHFLEDDEFELEGKFYDIISSTNSENKISYTCKVDGDDEELNSTKEHHQKKKATDQHSAILFCNDINEFDFSRNLIYEPKIFFSYQSKGLARLSTLEGPPPRL